MLILSFLRVYNALSVPFDIIAKGERSTDHLFRQRNILFEKSDKQIECDSISREWKTKCNNWQTDWQTDRIVELYQTDWYTEWIRNGRAELNGLDWKAVWN